MLINSKKLHRIKRFLYKSYAYRFIDSWITYDEANRFESAKRQNSRNSLISIFLLCLRSVDLIIWFILAIIFSVLYISVSTVFAIIHRIIFYKSYDRKTGRFGDYIEQFAEVPGVGFMKALEGNLFSRQNIISPSLEIGIETGVISNLHFKGKKIDIGSEYAIEHLSDAQNIALWNHKVAFDIRHMPFKDNTFNTVLAVHVMDHFSELDESFKEIKRVLKPGGKFTFSLFSYYYLLASPLSLILSIIGLKHLAEWNGRIRAAQRGTFNTYTINEWKDITSKYGMHVVHAHYFLGGYVKYFWYVIRYYLGRRWGMSGIPSLMGVKYRSVKFPGLGLIRYLVSTYLIKIGYWLYYPFYVKEIKNTSDKGLNVFLVVEKE
jgi:SAM-dependent methyltransferase